MSYIAEEDVQKAKEMDLLTYLRNYEPQELVHVSGNTYCTKEHDSLRISNGKWHWFSHGFGGRSALDYLIKVKGLTFKQAVETIIGRSCNRPPIFYPREAVKEKELVVPAFSESTVCVEKYLQGRGIHPLVIRYCIEHKLLFESRDYHNAVFIGYDEIGIPRYGALRGTTGSYKGELSGSNKHFSFSLGESRTATTVHVFESAIDAMSFATLELMKGHDWQQDYLLSLAGVFQPKREKVVPVALKRCLDGHPSIHIVRLHLDNDKVGRGAAKGIIEGLQGKYVVFDEPPSCGKDVNDELRSYVKNNRTREEHER
jgi:hypothetical protein